MGARQIERTVRRGLEGLSEYSIFVRVQSSIFWFVLYTWAPTCFKFCNRRVQDGFFVQVTIRTWLKGICQNMPRAKLSWRLKKLKISIFYYRTPVQWLPGHVSTLPIFLMVFKCLKGLFILLVVEPHKHTTTSLQSLLSKNQTKMSKFLQKVTSSMIGPGSEVQNIWFGL